MLCFLRLLIFDPLEFFSKGLLFVGRNLIKIRPDDVGLVDFTVFRMCTGHGN
jgi:hypothetical protein